MRIVVDLAELEALARLHERETTELAGITLDLRRRLTTDLLDRVAAYGLPTRHVVYEAQRVVEALTAHVGELERFTLDLERVWAEAKGLAQGRRLAPGVSGRLPDLWWFRNAASPAGAGGQGAESLAFAAAAEPVVAATGAAPAPTADAAIALVIGTAAAEVGTLESDGPGGGGNHTTYWEELHPSFQGQPWCAAFVSWVFIHAERPLPPMGQWYGFSYVPSAYEYFRGIGRLFDDPQPGDVFIYAEQAHTGVVTSGLDAAGNFHTVEGNTSSGTYGSQTNGGGVYARVRHISAAEGFGRPDYDGPPHATG